jgi:hypothetical protein
MADNDVSVKFGAEIGGFAAATQEVKDKITQVASTAKEFASGMKEVGEALLAAFAVEKIVQFVEKMAELGTQTERTMAVLGISAQEVGELSLVAEITGTSMQAMTMSLQRLQTNLQTASDPASKTGKALAAIGLAAKDLVGIPIPDQMNKIADALSHYADGGNKTAIAMALLGRGAAGMLPAMKDGAAGLDRIREMADNAAATLSEKTTTALVDVHEHLATFGAALTSLGASIVAFFGPVISLVVQTMTDLVSQINLAIQTGTLWDVMCAGMAYIWNKFIQNLITGGQIIKDVLSLNWGEITAEWKAGLAAQLKLQEDHIAALAAMKLKAQDTLIDRESDAEVSGKPQPKPIDMGSGADTAAAVAAKGLEAEIKVLQTGLAEKKELLDQEVAQYKITKAQKFQSLQDWTDDAYGTEKELLANELALYKEGTTQYAAIKAKQLEADAKYSKDSTKINGDAIKAQQAEYMKMFSAVQTAFDSQLRGLLAGTTSWKNAFKAILGDLIIAFIQACEKMLFEHLAAEMAKTAGTVAGDTARTSSNVVAASASSALTVSNAIESIMASAAKTFAGIFGNLSPFMGPAAAVPAAAGEATVIGTIGGLYEQGTPWVPSTGWALLHKGEAVIPAAVNAAGLGGPSGGGDTHVNFNFSGGPYDGASLAKWLNTNGDMINKVLGKKAVLSPGTAR